jgi:Flp pilus assembly protein TadD
MKRVGLVALALALLLGNRLAAAGADDQFIMVYNLIQAADNLRQNGQPQAATDKYLEAQTALERLAKEFPYWNPNIVGYRRQYIAEQLGPAAARAQSTNAVPVTPPPPKDEREQRLAALDQEIAGLRKERDLLEAKLREALAVKPATLDPRELARAEDRIKLLQKENDALRTNVAAQQAKLAQAADPAALAGARASLKKANDDLARQSAQLATVTRDRDKLQTRLQKREATTAPAADAAALAAAQQAAKDANLALSRQSVTLTKLTQEKAALEQRLKDADARLAAPSHAAPPTPPKESPDKTGSAAGTAQVNALKQRLTAAQNELVAEQKRAATLESEKAALEKRLGELAGKPAPVVAAPAPAPTVTAVPPPPANTKAARAESKRQTRELERERNELRKQVAALNRELDSRHERKQLAQGGELAEEVTILRARLAAYESQKDAYTPEELALFKPTASVSQPKVPTLGAKPVREVPAAAMPLIAEAQRAFAGHQLADAEAKYAQALQYDEKNVAMLGDLAATQIEQDHLATAETTLQRALALDSQNANALSLMGLLRFKQKRFDDALDLLSRSVKYNPDNPIAQNYLGITLSEKGLRGPAEAALRRAVTLAPGFAEAHNNLAVIYATQKPPFLELARWHYERARAAGQPRQPELEKLLNGDAKQP